ncbi:hypothetical protein ACFE04_013208 [Oxalis oulophora]
MESTDFPSKSPRNNINFQGPRPTPLKVSKDSHKINKKPPIPPQQQIRPPVIIYTVSPKVIHTSPGHFMDLVQRLTGLSGTSSSNPTNISSTSNNCGAISPAARYASVHKVNNYMSPKEGCTRSLMQLEQERQQLLLHSENHQDAINLMNLEASNLFPGILSPGPNSLPPISPNMFLPQEFRDPNMMMSSNQVSLYHDLSPVIHGNRHFIEGSFMPSPSSFAASPYIVSPHSFDLFNNFFD